MSSSTEPKFLSFPDGDIVLRSSDGVEFRVDSIILRRSSTFFVDMLSVPGSSGISSTTTLEPETLELTENSIVLDLLLRLLYSLDPELPPIPDSEADKISFLIAVDKFQISHRVVNDTAACIYASFPALRAWALAIKFHSTAQRKAACERVLVDCVDVLGQVEQVKELDEISARAVSRLHRIQQKAIKEAAAVMDEFPVACSKHSSGRWWDGPRATWKDHPFASEAYADSRCFDIVRGADCGECRIRFNALAPRVNRQLKREKVQSLLEAAIEEESEAVDASSK
ncbi:hypothetical protein DL93DRAFT_2089104 [Clavulina sp. PMI_390]|nr:hypothetical protein DL93DRAFT_2089104 [Clavulina sp. PMI_390]